MKFPQLEKLGLPGVVGIGLILFCLSFYFGNVVPLREELLRLESERSQLVAQQAIRRDAAAERAPPAADPLPPLSEAPAFLKQLMALAERNGAVVERASYRLGGRGGTRRLEISMPLKIAYPALRAYLREALVLSPAAALDELILVRGLASDTTLDAQLRLSYGFAGPP